MKTVLTHYTQYNLWANNTIIDIIEKLTVEQYVEPQKSSFKSIQETIFHIADVEYNWLQRLQQNNTWEAKATNYGNDVNALKIFLIAQSTNLTQLVAESNITELMQPIGYKNLKGETFNTELYKILMHVVNHGTHHRGQIYTMLHGAGYNALPSIDFIKYVRL